MNSSRRAFLKFAAASASLAAFPPLTRRASGFLADNALQAKLAADPLRPHFLLLPPKNWINHPTGPFLRTALSQSFSNKTHNAAVGGNRPWNQPVSKNMFKGRTMRMALAPTPGGAAADGCFTASAVNDNGTAAILYTGVQETPFE